MKDISIATSKREDGSSIQLRNAAELNLGIFAVAVNVLRSVKSLNWQLDKSDLL
jgi:hypothetical protein